MAVSRALRRLLRVRNLEEDLSRTALEAGLSELHQLEHTRTISEGRERSGRRLIFSSSQSGDVGDRLAGIIEVQAAARQADLLASKIVEAERGVAELRQQFMEKRIERRQAETMVRESEERAAHEADRRGQQASDEWFLSRMARAESADLEK